MNKFDRMSARRGIGGSGRRAERKTAKRVGGRVTPASGATLAAKGDYTLPDFLCENKSTVNDSMSLKFDWLDKISREALGAGKEPALSLQFTDASGKPRRHGSFVLITESAFIAMQKGE